MGWERKPSHVLGGVAVGRVIDGERALPKSLAKVLRRARSMAQSDRLSWADSSLAAIGRNILDHQRHPETGDFLRQALSDAEALYAVLTAAVEALAPPVGLPPVEPRPTADLGVASVRQG